MPKYKIAIVGPESTGKSTLTKQLVEYFKTRYLTEYARTYINELDRNYCYEDLAIIAQKQVELKNQMLLNEEAIFFADTSLLTIEIWSRDKFNKCDSWISDEIQKEKFDLYLLCDIDTPWVYDKQREDENRREEIFELYKYCLNKYCFKYELVSGLGSERLSNAVLAINKYMEIER